MKVILELRDDKATKVDVEGKASYDELVAVLFAALQGFTEILVEDAAKEGEDITLDVYESLTAIFESFLQAALPNISKNPFEFSDAAVLYAEDLIIERAEKEGKTFEEVLKAFEDEARIYVKEHGRVS